MNRRLVLLAVLALAISGCKKEAASDEDATAKPLVQVTLATVARGDISQRVSVTGAVSPLPDHEAKVSPLVAGKIVAVLVKTGDVVKKGQTIATLSPGTTPGQIQQAEAAVQLAHETLTQSRLNFKSQLETQQGAVNLANLAVQASQVALAKLRAGSRPQEIAQANANLASAQAALTAARQSLTRAQALFSEGLMARKDLEAAQATQRAAAASVTSAQQALSLARQGNRPEDIRAGEVALSQAQETLRAARAQSVQNQAKRQDVQIAAAQLSSAEGALRAIRAQAGFLTITAPTAGTIVGRPVNSGENVDVTTVVANIVDLDKVRILLNVSADQTPEIRPGQVVAFSPNDNPDVKHEAIVTTINRAVDPATNTVQVEAIANNADHSLRDDTFVKAEITVRTDHAAILVPTSAVVEKDGKLVVFTAQEDKTVKSRPVSTGIQDGKRIEVKSGLRAGEKVVTSGAYELDDGNAIEVGS